MSNKKISMMSVKEVLKQKIRFRNGTSKIMFQEDRGGWRCLACSTMCPGSSPEALLFHSYGKKHRSNLRKLQGGPPDSPKSEEPKDVSSRILIENAIKTSKEPLLGLEYLLEVTNSQDGNSRYYHCLFCMMGGDHASVIAHFKGIPHTSSYLKTYFPTVYGALRYIRENAESRKTWKQLVHTVACEIEKTFGRLEPSIIEKSKFESKKEYYIQVVRKSTNHIAETPEHTFMDLIPQHLISGMVINKDLNAAATKVDESSEYITEDMKLEWKKYVEDPGTYPYCEEEWVKFWRGRYKELLEEGRDADNYDYESEWEVYWNKRSLELVIESRKYSSNPGGIKRDHDDDLQISFKRGRSKSPPTFVSRKDEASSIQSGTLPVRPWNSSPRPVEPPPLHWSPPPGLRDSPNRQYSGSPPRSPSHLRNPPSLSRDTPPLRFEGPPQTSQRREASPHRSGGPSSTFQHREASTYRSGGPPTTSSYRSGGPSSTSQLRETSPYRSGGPPSTSQRREASPRRSGGPPSTSQLREAPPLRFEGPPSTSPRREAPPRQSGGPPPTSQHGEAPPLRFEGPPSTSQRREAPPCQSGGPPPTSQRREDPPPRDFNYYTLYVLRLLTALETRLGSLGPRITDLLSQALVIESEKSGSFENLVDENKILLITVGEKLKGQILAGLVTGVEKKALRDAIWRIEKLVEESAKKKNQQEGDSEMTAKESQQSTKNAALPQSSSVQDDHAKKQAPSYDYGSLEAVARTISQNVFKNQTLQSDSQSAIRSVGNDNKTPGYGDLQSRTSQDLSHNNPGSERYSPSMSLNAQDNDHRSPGFGEAQKFSKDRSFKTQGSERYSPSPMSLEDPEENDRRSPDFQSGMNTNEISKFPLGAIKTNESRLGNTSHQNRIDDPPAGHQAISYPKFSPPSNLANPSFPSGCNPFNPSDFKPCDMVGRQDPTSRNIPSNLAPPIFPSCSNPLNPSDYKPWDMKGRQGPSSENTPFSSLNSSRFFDRPSATSIGNFQPPPSERLRYSRFSQSSSNTDTLRYTENLLVYNTWEAENSEELERRISVFRAQMTARGLMSSSGYGPSNKSSSSDRRRDEEERYYGSDRKRR